MSVTGAQQRCEAAIWLALADHKRHGSDRQAHGDITAAMNGYLAAYARQYVERMTPDELRGRLKLAEAAAEADGKATP